MNQSPSCPATLKDVKAGDWLVRTTPRNGTRQAVQVVRVEASALWITDLVTPYAVAYDRQGQRISHPRAGQPADTLSAGAADLANLIADAQTARRDHSDRQDAARAARAVPMSDGAHTNPAYRLCRRLQEVPARTWAKLSPDELRQVAAWLGLKEE